MTDIFRKTTINPERHELTFKNEFGTAVLTQVGERQPVYTVRSSDPLARQNMFTVEAAEQLALITDNRHIQLVFEFPLNGMAFVMMHLGPSMCAICSMRIEEFVCDTSAREKIQDLKGGSVLSQAAVDVSGIMP